MNIRFQPILLWAATLLLAGCASLPDRPATLPTSAITDVAETPLARIAAAAVPADRQGLSGFRALPEGPTAFNARIALMRRAQKSLDVQYYLLRGDDIGRQIMRELRDAAQRGVQVRLLVDDLYTSGDEDLLAGLAAFPNAEVRPFNPLPARAGSNKVAGLPPGSEGTTVTEKTVRVFATAREQAILVSPYFIPGERGMASAARAGGCA